jgi:hypothetical protein
MALAKVETLILAFNTGEIGPDPIGAEFEDWATYLRESDALLKFLSTCHSLTKLYLSFDSISPEAQATSIDHIVGKTNWHSLHQIAFRRFKIPSEQFLLFLRRHKDSLRDVVLEDMCIVSPPETCSSLLSGVRALNIPWKRFRAVEILHQDGLQDATFFVEGSYSGNGLYAAQMVEDYVTRKTDFNPLKAITVDEETETVWHDEWEDVSDEGEMEVTEV